MTAISNFIDEMNNWHFIIKTIIGSAIFALVVLISKKIFKSLQKINKTAKVVREIDELKRYFIHKYYVSSNGLFYFSQGFFIVIYEVLKKLLKAIIIGVFWIVAQIFSDNNFFVNIFFCGLILSVIIEALNWFNPKLSKKSIEKYDPEIVAKVKKALLDETLEERDINKSIKSKKEQLDILTEEISVLSNQLIGKQEGK